MPLCQSSTVFQQPVKSNLDARVGLGDACRPEHKSGLNTNEEIPSAKIANNRLLPTENFGNASSVRVGEGFFHKLLG